jgi:hypothetical protein
MLLAAGCGDSPSVEQTADQVVTVTVTKTVGTTDGTPTDDGSTSTEEPSDQGLAGIGDTITLRGYEEGTEVAVTVYRHELEVPKNATPAVFQFALESGFADETGEWQLR